MEVEGNLIFLRPYLFYESPYLAERPYTARANLAPVEYMEAIDVAAVLDNGMDPVIDRPGYFGVGKGVSEAAHSRADP